MASTKPTKAKNLDGYGAPIIEWNRVLDTIKQGFTQVPDTGGPNRYSCWLSTVRPDGKPHTMPLGVVWVDGAFYFTAGPGTRKARNLAQNSHCAISVASHDFDLVVEGEATIVRDPAKLQRLADVYAAEGWQPTVRDGAFYAEYSAPSAGPPPWELYEVIPETIFGLGTSEPYGATRWDF